MLRFVLGVLFGLASLFLIGRKQEKPVPKTKKADKREKPARLLELTGHGDEGFKYGKLYLPDPRVRYLDNGEYLGYIPAGKDVWSIVNIPHYHPSHCPHEHTIATLSYTGGSICMGCGDRIYPTPSTQLNIRTDPGQSFHAGNDAWIIRPDAE